MNVRAVFKNISYSLFANLFSLAVSICMVAVVPKFLPVEQYGMWQLFLFYFSYLGFFHFGWEDGIYLRYAGQRFDELDKKKLAGQLWAIMALQIVIACVIGLAAAFVVCDGVKARVLACIAVLLPFVNFNNACNQIMQFTNRIKDYACLLLAERCILLLGIGTSIAVGARSFFPLYLSKVCSLVCVALIGGTLCRSLLLPRFAPLPEVVRDARANLSAGSKLMFANVANMLIIGVVRYGISVGWNVATFGRVSLTLGISNFLMVFINAFSIVFFPMLKHVEHEKLPGLYVKIRSSLSLMLLALLLGYYPAKSLLSWWLPKYSESLMYMSVLFPVCMFESKVQLLVNTYLKSMRKEGTMLKINAASVCVSVFVTFLTVKLWHNLDAAVFSIVFLYAFRCLLAEHTVQKFLGLSMKADMEQELALVAVFIVSGWFVRSWLCMAVYGAAYGVFAAFRLATIRVLFAELKKLR